MKLFFLAFLSLFMGCSSTSLTSPPDENTMLDLSSKLNSETSFEEPTEHTNSTYALAFLKGNHLASLGKQTEACHYYQFLSKNEAFVLQKLAWIRALENC